MDRKDKVVPISSIGRMHSSINETAEERYGLHPYDSLCFECTLSECSTKSYKCLQRMVVAASGAKQIKMHHRIGWGLKTKLMIQAGLACLLGDLIDVYNLREEVSQHKQIPIEEIDVKHPNNLVFKAKVI